jgi:hypothetical protein
MKPMTGTKKLREALEALEADIASEPDITDLDRADGLLLVAGLYKWGIDRAIVGADTQRPRFVRFMDTFSKWGLANPDNLYLVAEVDSAAEYRIVGKRGSCIDMIIEVRTGIGRREDDVHSETLSFIEVSKMRIEADGSFEVRLGGAPGPGNFLVLPPQATTIFCRQTFGDWTSETPATLLIERLGEAPPPAPWPSLEDVARQLDRAGDIVLALGRFNHKTAVQWRASLLVNTFPAPSAKVGDGFFPGQHSAIGQFRLSDPEQALVVSLDAVEARYLGFSLGHLRWHRSFDYHNRQCSLNTQQARLSSDGRYHYIISAKDPGVPNWLDTGGNLEGVMFFRCQGLVGDSLGHPEATLVPLAEVRRALPDDEPRVTEPDRRESLRRRQLGAHQRFNY